jgi:hypothetical protein
MFPEGNNSEYPDPNHYRVQVFPLVFKDNKWESSQILHTIEVEYKNNNYAESQMAWNTIVRTIVRVGELNNRLNDLNVVLGSISKEINEKNKRELKKSYIEWVFLRETQRPLKVVIEGDIRGLRRLHNEGEHFLDQTTNIHSIWKKTDEINFTVLRNHVKLVQPFVVIDENKLKILRSMR